MVILTMILHLTIIEMDFANIVILFHSRHVDDWPLSSLAPTGWMVVVSIMRGIGGMLMVAFGGWESLMLI